MVEENVDVETTRTEAVAQAQVSPKMEVEGEASAVLGKFKDVDALARAYESLQAEFTRRSQRLRALEREVENLKETEGLSGAEKLRKTAQTRREATKQFDAFVAEVDASTAKTKPISLSEENVEETSSEGGMVAMNVKEQEKISAESKWKGESAALGGNAAQVPFGEEYADGKQESRPLEAVAGERQEKTVRSATVTEFALPTEGANGVSSWEQSLGEGAGYAACPQGKVTGSVPLVAGSEPAELSSEALFQKAFDNETVRLKIVGEYLSSLGRSGAPLTSAGAGVLATPPTRAKTVGQAGEMALQYFRKK